MGCMLVLGVAALLGLVIAVLLVSKTARVIAFAAWYQSGF